MKRSLLPVLMALILTAGCQEAYYSTMEKFGVHKRYILVDRVEEAKDAQEETKEQFQTALEKFTEVANFKGGDLEDKYNQLKEELDASEDKAKTMRDRIDKVQQVAEALFEEWAAELDQYTNQKLKLSSKEKLAETKLHYQELINAMRKAQSKVEPVLMAFRDHVLYLKHNLNAKAIASLQSELDTIETDVASLIDEMNSSIAEAEAFIKQMNSE